MVNAPVDKALISGREGVVAFGGVPFDSHYNKSMDRLSLCCLGGVLLGSFGCVKWICFCIKYDLYHNIHYHMNIHKIYQYE